MHDTAKEHQHSDVVDGDDGREELVGKCQETADQKQHSECNEPTPLSPQRRHRGRIKGDRHDIFPPRPLVNKYASPKGAEKM
jgi:hypothetical protein